MDKVADAEVLTTGSGRRQEISVLINKKVINALQHSSTVEYLKKAERVTGANVHDTDCVSQGSNLAFDYTREIFSAVKHFYNFLPTNL